ncbi:MAG TPA: hypothetical protein VLL08_06370, partial [Kineosporiaceae bacterium]|nr:hypothetical protein [Kineosporiaceae bacterium]
MRRLPAVLLASATVVPVLITALSSPSALAVSPGRLAAAGAATLSGRSALPAVSPADLAAGPAKPAAGPTRPATGPAKPAAGATPVATKVRRLPLSGVDVEARRALVAQESFAGSRGAPGAVARMTTSAPAILTKRLDTAGFQTLGVTWKATAIGPNLLISVRTRTASGWS